MKLRNLISVCVWTHPLSPSPCHLPPGYWISLKAIKLVYDIEDGMIPPTHDITAVKNTIYQFYNVSYMYYSNGKFYILSPSSPLPNLLALPESQPSLFSQPSFLTPTCTSFLPPLQLRNQYDILDHIYGNFSKSALAGLCKPLAECKSSQQYTTKCVSVYYSIPVFTTETFQVKMKYYLQVQAVYVELQNQVMHHQISSSLSCHSE